MAHRSIGREQPGFAAGSRSVSSLDALGGLTDWNQVAALLDPFYPAKKGEPALPAAPAIGSRSANRGRFPAGATAAECLYLAFASAEAERRMPSCEWTEVKSGQPSQVRSASAQRETRPAADIDIRAALSVLSLKREYETPPILDSA